VEDLVSAPWLRRLITVTLLAGLVVLGFRVMEPFIIPVVWAAILAFVTWPVYERVLRACRGRAIIASLLLTTAVSLAVIVPIAWLALVLRIELARVWHDTLDLLAGGLQLPPPVLKLPWVGEQLRELAERASRIRTFSDSSCARWPIIPSHRSCASLAASAAKRQRWH